MVAIVPFRPAISRSRLRPSRNGTISTAPQRWCPSIPPFGRSGHRVIACIPFGCVVQVMTSRTCMAGSSTRRGPDGSPRASSSRQVAPTGAASGIRSVRSSARIRVIEASRIR